MALGPVGLFGAGVSKTGRDAVIIKGYASIGAGQVHYRRLHGPGLPVVCLHQPAS